MSDCVPAAIRIGGILLPAEIAAFTAIVARERLTRPEGAPFVIAEISGREPIDLVCDAAICGSLDEIEAFCIAHRLPFRRWCGALPGLWEAERLVYDGRSEPRVYMATDSDLLVATEAEVRSLGSIEAVRAYFCSGDPCIPPFAILGTYPK